MRALKWVGGFVLALVVALALFVAFGLNALRGPISRVASQATGRELLIEGDLKPVWTWVHPRLRAEKVSFANPQWAQKDHMFKAQAVEIALSVAPLFAGRVVLPEVHLARPEVNLEMTPDGRKNWLLGRDQQARESRIHIRRLTLDQGLLAYDEPGRDISIAADLSTDEAGVLFVAKGVYKGLPLDATGRGGPVLAVRDDRTPYPLKADAKIGATRIKAEGSITNLAELSAIDMAIELRGESMAQLYDVVGIAFPKTPPYATSGRLIRSGKLVEYREFKGRVGESDLAGTLQVDTSAKRPFMRGNLGSRVLNLADLGVLVGTDEPRKSTGVLPDAPFDTARWDSVDTDVRLRAGTIKRPKQLPLEKLATRIVMREKVLTLDPLEFGIAGGRLVGPVRLDGSKDPIRADVKMKVQKLELAKLFPTVKESRMSVGDVGGLVELTGTGSSVARMLASAGGKIGLFVDSGQVSGFLMELAAIDLWGIARVKLRGDEPVEIRCAIADFGVKNGMMHANALVFDTSVVNIGGSGTVNLKNEQMDLKLMPEPKDRSIASLNSPLYVRGTFSSPKPSPDYRRITTRGVGALVMGIINPFLAVIPLINQGPGKDSNCAKLISEATSSARSAASGATAPRPPSRSAR